MKPKIINPLFMYLDPGNGVFLTQLIFFGAPVLLVGAGVVYWIIQVEKRKKKCPQCGVTNTKDTLFCKACGHQFQMK